MSWIKSGIKSALKAAASEVGATARELSREVARAVAPPSFRNPKDYMKEHIAYVRSFLDAAIQERLADWDKLALHYR